MKQTDGHQIVNNMNNSFRDRFQALYLSTWIPIRDKLDEEPDKPPQRRLDRIITERQLPDRAVANEALNDAVICQITTSYKIARQTPKIPPPKNASEVQSLSDDEDAVTHPTIIGDETSRDIRQTQYPTTSRRFLSSNPEDPTETSQPHANNLGNTGDRDHQDAFCDVLATEPVLSGGNPGARDNLNTNDETNEDYRTTYNAWDIPDNTSTTAVFAGYGRDEGAGNYSTDSDGSSTGRAERTGMAVTRPLSYILRGDSYVG